MTETRSGVKYIKLNIQLILCCVDSIITLLLQYIQQDSSFQDDSIN
jgi:hypothetical protein